MIEAPINKSKDWLFEKIHNNNLIYNTCWEDPRCDRNLLNLNQNSSVVMITSAGCNALDYLLDQPSSINCVDLNYRQNALMELKKAFFKRSNHNFLFNFFGKGHYNEAYYYYLLNLRDALPQYAKKFWDDKIDKYFKSKPLRQSFYFHGTTGTFAWMFNAYLRLNKSLQDDIYQLLGANDLDTQKYWYDKIENSLINDFVKWIMKQSFTLSLLGIPRTQSDLITKDYEGGIEAFITNALRHIFTKIPVNENYFWRLYIQGNYTVSCCPNYLKEKNFENIKKQIDKIQTHTCSISEFLINNPGKYSHFVLLDHQDWLAKNNQDALIEEWKLILKNSIPGTKILMRSGHNSIEYFPKFISDYIDFNNKNTKAQHHLDRVGTYGSVYCGTVKQTS